MTKDWPWDSSSRVHIGWRRNSRKEKIDLNRQHLTPLLTGLLEHARRNPVPFHIPGHKKGAGMAPEFAELLGKRALEIDLVNIEPADDFHQPHGIIREAQELAAEAFGADHTFFSVQGTSCAVMSMIMSVCGPGDKIVLPRNIHRSALTGLILSGATPVFMAPELDSRLGITHGVSVNTVRQALAANPDAKALLIVNPTYFGVAADIVTITGLAHSAGVPVLVDEAHGAHLYFHEGLSVSGMQAQADLTATSVHKLGGSLTQTSVLNVREGYVNPRRVQALLSLLTTTSTSYLLLASLDAARKQLATQGRSMIEQAIGLADEARRAINQMPGLSCFGAEIVDRQLSSARFDHDPTKLCICTRSLGLPGTAVERLLRDEFAIEVELSDPSNILCVVSLGDDAHSIQSLIRALTCISNRSLGSGTVAVDLSLPVMPILAMSPQQAFTAKTQLVPLNQSEGRIIAESIQVYPPGIPVLLPGEVISADSVVYIQDCLKLSLPIQGTEDPTLSHVRVVHQ